MIPLPPDIAHRWFKRNTFITGWARSDKSILRTTLGLCPSDHYVRKRNRMHVILQPQSYHSFLRLCSVSPETRRNTSGVYRGCMGVPDRPSLTPANCTPGVVWSALLQWVRVMGSTEGARMEDPYGWRTANDSVVCGSPCIIHSNKHNSKIIMASRLRVKSRSRKVMSERKDTVTTRHARTRKKKPKWWKGQHVLRVARRLKG